LDVRSSRGPAYPRPSFYGCLAYSGREIGGEERRWSAGSGPLSGEVGVALFGDRCWGLKVRTATVDAVK
jgi:hypothetical protein